MAAARVFRRRPLGGTAATSDPEERLLVHSEDEDHDEIEDNAEENAVHVEEGEEGQIDFRRKDGGSRRSVRIATGVLDTISQKYESLDYEVNFNSLMLDEIRKRGWKFVLAKVSS
jgi:hypothetical protein